MPDNENKKLMICFKGTDEDELRKLLGNDKLEESYLKIYNDPKAGDFVRGYDSIRKLRSGVNLSGTKKGASRGARIIYYYDASENIVVILAAFAKGEKTDLLIDDYARHDHEARKIVAQIKNERNKSGIIKTNNKLFYFTEKYSKTEVQRITTRRSINSAYVINQAIKDLILLSEKSVFFTVEQAIIGMLLQADSPLTATEIRRQLKQHSILVPEDVFNRSLQALQIEPIDNRYSLSPEFKSYRPVDMRKLYTLDRHVLENIEVGNRVISKMITDLPDAFIESHPLFINKNPNEVIQKIVKNIGFQIINPKECDFNKINQGDCKDYIFTEEPTNLTIAQEKAYQQWRKQPLNLKEAREKVAALKYTPIISSFPMNEDNLPKIAEDFRVLENFYPDFIEAYNRDEINGINDVIEFLKEHKANNIAIRALVAKQRDHKLKKPLKNYKYEDSINKRLFGIVERQYAVLERDLAYLQSNPETTIGEIEESLRYTSRKVAYRALEDSLIIAYLRKEVQPCKDMIFDSNFRAPLNVLDILENQHPSEYPKLDLWREYLIPCDNIPKAVRDFKVLEHFYKDAVLACSEGKVNNIDDVLNMLEQHKNNNIAIPFLQDRDAIYQNKGLFKPYKGFKYENTYSPILLSFVDKQYEILERDLTYLKQNSNLTRAKILSVLNYSHLQFSRQVPSDDYIAFCLENGWQNNFSTFSKKFNGVLWDLNKLLDNRTTNYPEMPHDDVYLSKKISDAVTLDEKIRTIAEKSDKIRSNIKTLNDNLENITQRSETVGANLKEIEQKIQEFELSAAKQLSAQESIESILVVKDKTDPAHASVHLPKIKETQTNPKQIKDIGVPDNKPTEKLIKVNLYGMEFEIPESEYIVSTTEKRLRYEDIDPHIHLKVLEIIDDKGRKISYSCSKLDPNGYITFKYRDLENIKIKSLQMVAGLIHETSGWKVHFSFAPDAKNHVLGCNILLEVAQSYGLDVKFLTDQALGRDSIQLGKSAVWFLEDVRQPGQPQKIIPNIPEIMSVIYNKMVTAGVKFGPTAPGDAEFPLVINNELRHISGIGYRCAKDEKGNYIESPSNTRGYNPGNLRDPILRYYQDHNIPVTLKQIPNLNSSLPKPQVKVPEVKLEPATQPVKLMPTQKLIEPPTLSVEIQPPKIGWMTKGHRAAKNIGISTYYIRISPFYYRTIHSNGDNITRTFMLLGQAGQWSSDFLIEQNVTMHLFADYCQDTNFMTYVIVNTMRGMDDMATFTALPVVEGAIQAATIPSMVDKWAYKKWRIVSDEVIPDVLNFSPDQCHAYHAAKRLDIDTAMYYLDQSFQAESSRPKNKVYMQGKTTSEPDPFIMEELQRLKIIVPIESMSESENKVKVGKNHLSLGNKISPHPSIIIVK